MIVSLLVIIACSLLVISILMQNNQGGGIQSQFVKVNNIIGAKKGTRFIEKTTLGLAAFLILLTVLIGLNY